MVTEHVWSWFAPKLAGDVHAPTFVPAPAEIAATTLDALATRVLDEATRAGFDRFHLVGHSMGGRIAQLVAARASARLHSLTLVNPVPVTGLAFPPEVATLFRTSGGNRAAQGAILDQACLALAPADKAALLDVAATIDPAWIARGLDLFIAPGDPAVLAAIACPTLVVATDDPFLPPAFLDETVARPIRSARLTTLHGPGHYPQVEHPDALAAIVTSFLADVAR